MLYINDLPENIVSNVYMFADDIKVFKTITSPNDQHTLQNDLDYLTSWSSKWLLRFHPNKCNCRENNTAGVCIQPKDR